LEDLEPHRFEDLVRQLLYDFRPWRSLEATGRTGTDRGFDVRAIEIVPSEPVDLDGSDAEEDAEIAGGRVWLIQCKREKEIGPLKLVGYLDEIAETAVLYGIIFAAACDFSIAARDRFREKARELRFDEAYLWGKAEIEDQLFQLKNDHLLFAYFGVSLQTRRRTLKTEVRTKLAMKRKALRVLDSHKGRPVLLRDASDNRYPYMDPDEKKTTIERRRWNVMNYRGVSWNGLYFVLSQHPAYVSDDRQEWDFAEKFNSGPVGPFENPWGSENGNLDEARTETFDVWNALSENNRFWYLVYAVLPFENILDIDENGDDFFDKPHIYTTEFRIQRDPFSAVAKALLPNNRLRGHSIMDEILARMDEDEPARPDPAKRVQKFQRRG
jgi:hypothetical protein